MAPQHCNSPLESAGFNRLLASMLPSAFPSPSSVCSSSTKSMTPPFASSTSFSTAFKRSSKSPLNLAPAMSSPRSSAITRLFLMLSGTSPRTMRWARPSSMAVFPVPAAPIRTGLFFVRRDRICIVRWISASLPITGSSFPSFARAVRSIPYCSRAGFSGSPPRFMRCVPPGG